MADDKFKLPGSSYQELTKIIQAYGQAPDDASLGQVAKLAAVHDTVVSRNNGFLAGIEVLEGGKKKSLTPKGKALAHALHHEMPDEIRKHWRTVVNENDFLKAVLSAVRIRKGMDPSTLQAHVAYSAGQPKKKAVLTGAAAVVDLLRAAELLVERDGRLLAALPQEAQSGSAEPTSPVPLATSVEALEVQKVVRAQKSSANGSSGVRVSLNINIQVQCVPADLDGLAVQLRDLMRLVLDEDGPGEPD